MPSPPKTRRISRSSKTADAVATVARATPPDRTVTTELAAIDYTRLQSISRVVVLNNVELISTAFHSYVDPRSLRREEAVGSTFELSLVDARWHRLDTRFEVVLGYEVTGALRENESHKEQTLFRLAATWVVTYSLPDDFQRPENHEEIAADFVIANGQVNVFPFLRHLVVDMTAKAGWPPLFLPVFRVPKNRPRGLVRNLPAWA